MSEQIDISGLSKAEVLAALFNNSAPQGLGFLQAGAASEMTVEMAEQALEQTSYFDYLAGRPMKLNLEGDSFDPWGYDRDNGGEGTARSIIDRLRESGDVNDDEAVQANGDLTKLKAHEAMQMANQVSEWDIPEDGGIPSLELGAADLGEPLQKAVDNEVRRVS